MEFNVNLYSSLFILQQDSVSIEAQLSKFIF